MALVAYDNSDSSEYEDDEPNQPSVSDGITNELKKVSAPSVSNQNITEKICESSTGVGASLFNLLPQPSSKKVVVEEEDDEFLHKKETASSAVKPKARIMVPSLSDFKDVEKSVSSKPKAPSSKKCGLLSLLPQPKTSFIATSTSKTMIPHVLTQQAAKPPKKTTMPVPAQIIKTTTIENKLAIDYSDESDNDEDIQNDFFSINSKPEIPLEDVVPLDIDNNIQPLRTETASSQKLPRSVESYFKQNGIESSVEQAEEMETPKETEDSSDYAGSSGYGNDNQTGVASSSSDLGLDDEAIRQLCGTRGKRKREEIRIVDVNQQEVLADAQEWFRKGLMEDTTNRVSASKKKGNEPTNQQRRKHQITYLAHQAKANEAELQNQWANNRNNKRQAASKYGF